MKRIFLFHHAGGDKYAYRTLQQHLSLYYEPIAVELPGRGDRYAEPLLSDLHEATEDLFSQIKLLLTSEYALAGISMGALMAFLLTHRILQENLPLPHHLFLASRKSILGYLNHKAISQLPSKDFWAGVVAYGGVSEWLLAHSELISLYEPILRADFHALEQFAPNTFPPLPVTTSILIGEDDAIKTQDIVPWQEYFVPKIETHIFQGSHFFVYEQPEALSAYITSKFPK